MHVAFGRVRRKIALLRTSFSLMRKSYSEMVLQCFVRLYNYCERASTSSLSSRCPSGPGVLSKAVM